MQETPTLVWLKKLMLVFITDEVLSLVLKVRMDDCREVRSQGTSTTVSFWYNRSCNINQPGETSVKTGATEGPLMTEFMCLYLHLFRTLELVWFRVGGTRLPSTRLLVVER